ncbi:hypothetical protein I5Q34_20545 [Streptomyces sp. AV19]|uniref:hypothetical protein n=1 Tax=Streptomyces sp. AV19 TaxID=2793068 RepID=UPI0018FEC48B|nr:hypothetical protein [Streptomyces sp. AV19]MBH1936637.1 hypothetical protein [Streptomyces sp. AV19]MDG4532698.1 hypothetical protein [Streptomyces sp. AV19]
MFSKSGIAMAVVAGIVLIAATSGGGAAAPLHTGNAPHAVTGPVIPGGADGRPRLLQCPPSEWAYGGGYSVTPAAGRQLAPQATDVVESHPNDNGTGWIVAVRKDHYRTPWGIESSPANLTVHAVCTEGQAGPHGG